MPNSLEPREDTDKGCAAAIGLFIGAFFVLGGLAALFSWLLEPIRYHIIEGNLALTYFSYFVLGATALLMAASILQRFRQSTSGPIIVGGGWFFLHPLILSIAYAGGINKLATCIGLVCGLIGVIPVAGVLAIMHGDSLWWKLILEWCLGTGIVMIGQGIGRGRFSRKSDKQK